MEKTQEQITESVLAAFNSVDLINLAEEDADTIERNVEHLRIMMGYEWFSSALTAKQKKTINTIIA